MPRLLVIDTETSGTDPALHSILSFACLVWENGSEGNSLSFLVREASKVVADPEAMKINGIDLSDIQAKGCTPRAAVDSIDTFCAQNFPESRRGDKVVLAGHNICFDVAFLRRLYAVAGRNFDAIFSHRMIDTASIVRFLGLAGFLDLPEPSSDSAFRHFGIAPDRNSRHTALGDARATHALLNHLIGLLCNRGGQMANRNYDPVAQNPK